MADYTSSAQIAAYLGITLTAAQAQQADVAAHAITAWIDHRTGRTWQNGASVTDEHQTVAGASVYLDHPPVLAVSQLEYLSGITWVVVDPSSYTLTDPQDGVITVSGGYNGDTVRVDYTTDQTAPPPDLAFAATVLASDLLFTTLHPESSGLDSISVGQNDLTIRYATASADGSGSSAISLAARVIDAYRRVVFA